MRKRVIALVVSGLFLTACEPHVFWYENYTKERQAEIGKASRDLCDPDPWAPECPYKPASDGTVCDEEPELCKPE